MYRTSVRYKHERVWERKGSGHQVEGAQTHGKKVRKTLLKARSGPSRRVESRHRRRGEGKFEGRGQEDDGARRDCEGRLFSASFFKRGDLREDGHEGGRKEAVGLRGKGHGPKGHGSLRGQEGGNRPDERDGTLRAFLIFLFSLRRNFLSPPLTRRCTKERSGFQFLLSGDEPTLFDGIPGCYRCRYCCCVA